MDSCALIESLLNPDAVSEIEIALPSMPLAVEAAFSICAIELYGMRFAVARIRGEAQADGRKPSELAGLADMVSAKAGLPVILHAGRLTPYLRKKFLKESRAFVCDDGQFFIPGLVNVNGGKTPARYLVSKGEMSPSTKLLFLYILEGAFGPYTVEGAQKRIGLSRAAVQKSFEDLVALGILESRIGGATARKRIYSPVEEESLFEDGRRAFGSAVRRSFSTYENNIPERNLSGLSALAERSLLMGPRRKIYALPAKDVKGLAVVDPDSDDDGVCDVQVLSYDPAAFASGGLVDRFTMLATIGDSSDERVAIAIEEAMEGCKWYR